MTNHFNLSFIVPLAQKKYQEMAGDREKTYFYNQTKCHVQTGEVNSEMLSAPFL